MSRGKPCGLSRREPEPCKCCEGYLNEFLAFPVYHRDGRFVQGGLYDCANEIPPDALTIEQVDELQAAIAAAGNHYELIPHTGGRP
jgi:hypothetical protein